ncbi:hypothetical protein [Streptomyces sp. NBC_00687]|uniref:hypothetical protein n=1 Tax=Streptomyces sp. NBC_00687 TaxID=2975807 RepID=UPI00225BED9F|nr:hypothetical protein [Streptomyces sp. NBC_00687]MCX4919009.1 hypothetical protein [Streptomyces sp. NBC_00687]
MRMTLSSAETTEAALLKLRGARLIESATTDRELAAAQTLVDEETILSHRSVHGALGLLDLPSEATVRREGLMGRVYALGLDYEERVFLGLTLSMVGIGNTPLSAASDLGERRMASILRAIARLAGNAPPSQWAGGSDRPQVPATGALGGSPVAGPTPAHPQLPSAA